MKTCFLWATPLRDPAEHIIARKSRATGSVLDGRVCNETLGRTGSGLALVLLSPCPNYYLSQLRFDSHLYNNTTMLNRKSLSKE